jgi:hypothetical protein
MQILHEKDLLRRGCGLEISRVAFREIHRMNDFLPFASVLWKKTHSAIKSAFEQLRFKFIAFIGYAR